MNHPYRRLYLLGLLLLLCGLAGSFSLSAQTDTAQRIPIEILPGNGTLLEHFSTDSGAITKLIHNVSLRQGETLMYCDSAYILREKNQLQAWGNVHIIQDNGATEVFSDYLRYTGNNRKAFLSGNVHLRDEGNHLWCPELEYNMATKIGIYSKGGTLQNDTTTLSSNKGIYYAQSKEARFTEEVMITDPGYEIHSQDLGYNTETRVVQFFGPSVVTSDSAVLHTSRGTWDAVREHALFTSRSSVWNKEQYVEGDTIDFYKKSGFGEAWGNVILLDTVQQTTLYAGHTRYNQHTRQMLATIKPVLKKQSGTDSLFIRADTFYAGVVTKDTSGNFVYHKGPVQMDTSHITPVRDTAKEAALRFFTGYPNVLIFSDSLQARCDSISYSQTDSVLRLIRHPIAWSRNSQITGDTILLYMDSSNHLSRMYVPNNAFVVSRSGPEQAQLFDQVQGKTLTGYFDSNTLRRMVVRPTASCIYYSTNDEGAYLGANEATSEQIRMYFQQEGIERIVLDQDVKHRMIPMIKLDIASMRLSRFRWEPEKRPKSLEEIFR